MDIKLLRSKAHDLEPVIRIGKNGLTGGTVEEVNRQLKRSKLIKIKFLKASLQDKSSNELAEEIAKKTGAVLVSRVGFVGVYYKE